MILSILELICGVMERVRWDDLLRGMEEDGEKSFACWSWRASGASVGEQQAK